VTITAANNPMGLLERARRVCDTVPRDGTVEALRRRSTRRLTTAAAALELLPELVTELDKNLRARQLADATVELERARARNPHDYRAAFQTWKMALAAYHQPGETPPPSPAVAAPNSDDPCAWQGRPVVALSTLQFAWGGLVDAQPADELVHLVRVANPGTPGPTLCSIDRFATGSPGWSVGGGITGPNRTLTPCRGCLAVAGRDYPNLPIEGSVGAAEIRAALQHESHWQAETSQA
jgi:hypothetical protein